jgi:predicted transposase YdaD
MAEQIITRDYGLPETPMMRKLREQGREEGRVAGREEGREEGRVAGREEGREDGREAERIALLLRQLARRCGPLSAATTTRVQHLDAVRLLDLADALLDFSSVDDLEAWLTTHGPPDQVRVQTFKRSNV